MGCCCAVLNLLLFVGSVCVLAVGISKQSDSPEGYSSFYDTKYYTSPSIVVAIGSVMTVVTGFGLLVGLCPCEFCTKPFKRILVFAIITIMVGGVIGYLCKDSALNNLLDHFQTTISSYEKDEAIKNSWDEMQLHEHCCGTYGFMDWENITSSIPNSCCQNNVGSMNCTSENALKEGCYITLKRTVDTNAIITVVSAIIIGFIQIIQIMIPYSRSSGYSYI